MLDFTPIGLRFPNSRDTIDTESYLLPKGKKKYPIAFMEVMSEALQFDAPACVFLPALMSTSAASKSVNSLFFFIFENRWVYCRRNTNSYTHDCA